MYQHLCEQNKAKDTNRASKGKTSGSDKENRTLENGLSVQSYRYLGHCKLFCQYFSFFFFPQYLCADEAQSASDDILFQDYDVTVRQSQKI